MDHKFRTKKTEQIAFFPMKYRGHIHNPGMGIISMAISDHMVKGYSDEARAKADKEPDFNLTEDMCRKVGGLEYIDNIYIRAGWRDVQKKAGKITLSPEIQMALEEASKAGKSIGLRIMHCSPSNPVKHLLPEFLENKLPLIPMSYPDCYFGPAPKMMPDYTDEYLNYWDEMLQLLGEQIDGMPNLEYCDLSGFGLWGEGHHGNGEDQFDHGFLEEVLERLIISHQSAFPSTPMVLNLHMIEHWKAGQKALDGGCWTRRDSYYDYFKAHQAQDGLNRQKSAGMIFETIMPGVSNVDSDDPAYVHTNLNCARGMCDYGTHYATVGFNMADTLYAAHVMPELFTIFSRGIGYRLRPSVIWKTSAEERDSLILGMVNDGAVPPPGTVCFYAASNGAEECVCVDGGCFERQMYLVEVPLPQRHDNKVILHMELTLGRKTFPVRFAVDTGEKEAPLELTVFTVHTQPGTF